MKPVNINDENSFDPTPKFKSSPIPINFISFNVKDKNCFFCGEKYIETLLCSHYYCKKCLSHYMHYINKIADNNLYLDVRTYTDHEISRTKVSQIIQGDRLGILYFKQIFGGYLHDRNSGLDNDNLNIYNEVIESEKDCKLCEKLLSYTNKQIDYLKLCSECYQISSGWIESTLVKKRISILYLPWWHYKLYCDSCFFSKLIFTSDCQKYCANCYIFYVGCRYCLTTNIIFGPTLKSQCKKCKRISLINSDFDDFLFNNDLICNNLDNLKLIEFENIIKNIDKYFEPENILNSIFREKHSINKIKWIPYSFINVEEITRGGYGIIYKATWLSNNETVILKRFENSKNIGKYFLNELRSLQHCFKEYNDRIIKTYGFTKDPESKDYMLVIKYASEGDLHKYLQKNFTKITWNKQKLILLWQISLGLETIHKAKFMHRDFHSGNVLCDLTDKKKSEKDYQLKVADLGLSQAVDNKSSNNEIYGVMPYIAPEIFKGSKFTKEADIYSLGMIMWELTTGLKPFDNVKHDVRLVYKILDGERPEITEDTPECYANLMKSCWDPDPKERPSIMTIRTMIYSWISKRSYNEMFNKAEAKRMELIQSKEIGPEFVENRHSEAIYISRSLSNIISKCSSISSSKDYSSLEMNFDIDTESSSSSTLSSMIQNSSSFFKKRNIEELDIRIHDNSASSNYF
ncbi:hypothetical protein RclHR1_03130020 [Rhizophagus clarus]|uniref:Protein kinase domain-containing protein n=1 Tax=Rhizophagus clarus TaxID=94130 RepID=A0A2Z6RLR8_9GLOM|nr:hypothetical protein RclHR1_03130020 [Rhizophagus clarus]